MGDRRQTSDGGQIYKHPELSAIVEGILYAIDLRIVTLPKSIHRYRPSLFAAFDGDFTLLNQAIANLRTLAKRHGKRSKDPIMLQRWQAGMRDSYIGMLYILSMFHQLLTEYYGSYHGQLNILSERFTWLKPRDTHKKQSGSRIARNYDI